MIELLSSEFKHFIFWYQKTLMDGHASVAHENAYLLIEYIHDLING